MTSTTDTLSFVCLNSGVTPNITLSKFKTAGAEYPEGHTAMPEDHSSVIHVLKGIKSKRCGSISEFSSGYNSRKLWLRLISRQSSNSYCCQNGPSAELQSDINSILAPD